MQPEYLASINSVEDFDRVIKEIYDIVEKYFEAGIRFTLVAFLDRGGNWRSVNTSDIVSYMPTDPIILDDYTKAGFFEKLASAPEAENISGYILVVSGASIVRLHGRYLSSGYSAHWGEPGMPASAFSYLECLNARLVDRYSAVPGLSRFSMN